jgi:F-type H+-transporting ATPase subunit gamma
MGKTVKILCLGRKGRDALRAQFKDAIIDTVEGLSRNVVRFETAGEVAARLAALFAKEEFDVCTLVYNRFQSAMTQHVTVRQVIPFAPAAEAAPQRHRPLSDRGPGPCTTWSHEEASRLLCAQSGGHSITPTEAMRRQGSDALMDTPPAGRVIDP